MVDIEVDSEADRFANLVLILSSSFVILTLILRLIIGNNIWTPSIAFFCGIVLCIGYYITVTLKSSQRKKEEKREIIVQLGILVLGTYLETVHTTNSAKES
jgi:hypothetical protein